MFIQKEEKQTTAAGGDSKKAPDKLDYSTYLYYCSNLDLDAIAIETSDLVAGGIDSVMYAAQCV